MTSIHELRASIDKLLDRWEDSASTLERETSAAIAGLTAEIGRAHV